MLGWIARIALFTAMRQGEILSLRLSQVILARRIVRLDHTKNGDSRIAPLSHEAAAVFRAAMEHVTAQAVLSPLPFYGETRKDKHRRCRTWCTGYGPRQ